MFSLAQNAIMDKPSNANDTCVGVKSDTVSPRKDVRVLIQPFKLSLHFTRLAKQLVVQGAPTKTHVRLGRPKKLILPWLW